MAERKHKPTGGGGSSRATVRNVDRTQTDWRQKPYTRVDLSDGSHIYLPKGHKLSGTARGSAVKITVG